MGKGSLLAYLVSMTLRIAEIYRVLKPTGSFYFHCDPKASHYLKIIIDAVFCSQSGDFLNEIIWRRTGAHNKSARYAPIHDTILFYSKSSKFTWNSPKRPYMSGHVREYFVKNDDGYRTNYYGNVLTGSGIRGGESGATWQGFNPTAKGRHWAIPKALVEDLDEDISHLTQHQKLDRLLELGFIKIVEGQAWPIYERYLKPEDGQPLSDIWAFQPHTEKTVFGTDEGIDKDVRWMTPKDKERLGYQTQKPEGLLERILKASSNEGEIVLDAYCGCGTTVAVSQILNRQWIGIDITYQSISVILKRLEDSFGKGILDNITLNGIPKDMKSAEALANKSDDRTRKEFEKWAVLTYSNNRAIINEKKGADGGIDGIAYFRSERDNPEKILFQVKSGKVDSGEVVKLQGAMTREEAVLGIFITLKPPTKAMIKEAKGLGIYKSQFMSAPVDKIRIVTVQEIIEEQKRLDILLALEVLKSAEKQMEVKQGTLDLE